MAIVILDNLRPGMVISMDLRTPDGRLLLPAGTTLSMQHLQLLGKWGVVGVHIKDTSAGLQSIPVPDSGRPECTGPIGHERHLQDVFRLVDRNDPTMAEFYRFLLARQGHLDRQNRDPE